MFRRLKSAATFFLAITLTYSLTAFTSTAHTPLETDPPAGDAQSDACPKDPNLVSVAPLGRSDLEASSSKMENLTAKSPEVTASAANELEVSGGSERKYVDGHTVTTVAGYVGGKPVAMSTMTTATTPQKQYVSLFELPTAAQPEQQPKDLLAGSGLSETEVPAGYYAKTCASYNGSCLRDLLNSGCGSGPCGFLFWNTYLLGGCLAEYCYVGSQKCCTRWVDSWHEYG